MMTKPAVAVLGIDLGKNSCSVAGLDDTGRVVLRRRLSREGVVRLAVDLPACVMAMEGREPLGRPCGGHRSALSVEDGIHRGADHIDTCRSGQEVRE